MQYVIGLIIVIAILVAAVWLIYAASVYVFTSVLILGDKLLGAWGFVPPHISWGVMGLLIGSLIYFAFIESRNLKRPIVKPLLLTVSISLIIASPIIGPMTGIRSTYQEQIPMLKIILTNAGAGVMDSPSAGSKNLLKLNPSSAV